MPIRELYRMKSKRSKITYNITNQQKKIGARIRALRIKAGYSSFEDFAYEHDMASSQLGRYERGASDMRLSTLMRILEALNVTFAEFFSEGFD